MSWDTFDDNCPGCKPTMVELDSGKVLPDDHPQMVALLKMWRETTIHERRAWHAFTCQNLRDPLTMALIPGLQQKMEQALAKAAP